MNKKNVILLACFILCMKAIKGQCVSFINTFPYTESFETTDGGWFAGGAGSDWTWGNPTKQVISAAAAGTRCWVVGGLTASSYTNSEASWLRSPCFNFSSLQYPYITFKVFWEMEQRFDGANLQYSLNNGNSWSDVGAYNEPANCLNDMWYNQASITYLATLSSTRNGWSGNIQPTSGSCQGGNGSNGWVTAKHIIPAIAGQPSVIFRFTFGAGTICNNYDGFAIDDILIGEAPPNLAGFSYNCVNNKTIDFTNTSLLCPTIFAWDFDDPASGTNNTSNLKDPSHIFSGPGTYSISLTASGPGNAPSTITNSVTILGLTTSIITPADCINNNGGSALATTTGGTGAYSYIWNTNPVQTTAAVIGLPAGTYSVMVNATDACPGSGDITIPVDLSCIGIYFPSAFTPNRDGRNDSFGPLGSLSSLTNYSFSIYNRWGERVFHTKNPFEKWNAEVKGQLAGTDSFTWFARYSLPGQEKVIRKGAIILIR